MIRHGGRWAALLTALAVLGSAACGSLWEDAPAAGLLPPGPYNVVLVVMDTVRADHVHAYGYERETTPNVDSLASEGTRFTRAMSTAPWTLPSHASMFTGLAPHEHGAHTFEVHRRENNVSPLPQDVPVIAEVFQSLGYQTAAFAANDVYLGRRWGLDRGFDTYEVKHAFADMHDKKVLWWLKQAGDEPFFLFVNYMDAHRPYNVAEVEGLLDEPPDPNNWLIDRLKTTVMSGRDPHPDELIQTVTAQYDTGIANLDAGIGEVVAALRAAGELDRTIFIVTADHGEYLGEHQLVEHNLDVYQQGLHVPLVIRSPMDLAGTEVEHVVTSQDLPWLIRSRLTDKKLVKALKPFDAPRELPVAENYYSRPWDVFNPAWGQRFRRVRHVVYDWPYKYVMSSDGQDELYDLESDPQEQDNLVDVDADVAHRLAQALEADLEERDDTPDQQRDPSLSPEEIEQMRALGYAD